MKKILFILHVPPPVHGSAVVGEIIKESELINNSFCCSYVNLSTSRTLDEIGKNPIKKASRYLLIILRVLKQLMFNRPDLCYFAITVKGIGFIKDATIALFIKLFRVKLVYHMHNKGVSSGDNRKYKDILYKMVFKNSKVILLSEYLYEDIHKYTLWKNVIICPNGISDVEYKTLKRVSTENKPAKLLFLSNLIESKGVFVLLEACRILKDKGIDFECTFVGGEGDISSNTFYKKTRELNLIDQVVYIGKKYGEEKNQIFSESDIFVFPTFYHNETFGLVNLEAMQHYLPVVSTFEGGIPSVVDDGVTGYLVPGRDIEVLADKLEYLILNPLTRIRMGIAGRKKYEEKFTLPIFENRIVDILNNELNNS